MISFFQQRIVSFAFSVSKFNTAKDYYKILNVSSSADQKQIKKAFRELAKKYHPDSNKGNQEKFKEINEAYQILSSQTDKKDYDQARNYGANRSQNPYSSQNNGTAYNGYQNNSYSNQHYNQQYYQQNPFFSADYRGYQKTTGWQNTQQRDRIMYEMFKKQQQYMNNYRQKYQQQQHREGRANYAGGFESMYANSTINPENIRKYTQQIKAKQQAVRKAYEQEQRRRQSEYKQYQEKQYQDMKQKLEKKMYSAAQGVADNIKGFFKMTSFVKGIWNDVKQTLLKDINSKEDQKKNKGKK